MLDFVYISLFLLLHSGKKKISQHKNQHQQTFAPGEPCISSLSLIRGINRDDQTEMLMKRSFCLCTMLLKIGTVSCSSTKLAGPRSTSPCCRALEQWLPGRTGPCRTTNPLALALVVYVNAVTTPATPLLPGIDCY